MSFSTTATKQTGLGSAAGHLSERYSRKASLGVRGPQEAEIRHRPHDYELNPLVWQASMVAIITLQPKTLLAAKITMALAKLNVIENELWEQVRVSRRMQLMKEEKKCNNDHELPLPRRRAVLAATVSQA